MTRTYTPEQTFLRVLHTHMISTIPSETLGLHYATQQEIQLDPKAIFDKVVVSGRGRGGYCLENNQLFLYVLRDLGFQASPVGARVWPRRDGVSQGEYMGWFISFRLFRLQTALAGWWMFASVEKGPTQPMRLADGAMIRNMGTQDVRLTRDFIPRQASRDPAHQMWLYQCRNSESLPWVAYYLFSDAVEWLAPDFSVINCFTGASIDRFAVENVLVVKFLRQSASDYFDGTQEIYGKRMLVNGALKENLDVKTTIVEKCRSEDQRVASLRKWFDIELTTAEILAIANHITELR